MGGAWWTVGPTTKRGFSEGACVAYDASYDHGAGNDGSTARWVLNVAVPHPDLSHGDRPVRSLDWPIYRPYSLEEFGRLSGHPMHARTVLLSSVEPLAFLCEAARSLEVAAPPRFAYMMQGDQEPEHTSWAHVLALPGESDLYRLSFATEQPPHRSSASLQVHFPGGTYTLGRSVLYSAVCWQELRQGWRYSFYVYADDDVQAVDEGVARSLSQEDIRRFHRGLLEDHPAGGFHDLAVVGSGSGR